WFTETAANKIGRITPTGSITEFPLPEIVNPTRIALGADGNLWFTGSKIGRIAANGSVTLIPIPASVDVSAATINYGFVGLLRSIAAAPDGSLWFTEWCADKILRMSPSGSFTEFPLTMFPFCPRVQQLQEIAFGSDGNAWFTITYAGGIGRIAGNV